jgi:hypothetical protein
MTEELTESEQQKARVALSRLPGMTMCVNQNTQCRTAEGLIQALNMCGSELQRLHDLIEERSRQRDVAERTAPTTWETP